MGAMIPLLGFLPDADATQPGVLTLCENIVPTERGMAAAPTPAEAVNGLPALAAACRGAAVLANTTGLRRMFAGTAGNLYELTGAAWTSVGSGYGSSSDNRWSFTQFGNAAIASNNVDAIQASTGGAFSAIAGAPDARIVIASKDFVLAFDTDDASNGRQSDRWWCSGFQNHAQWTPSVVTQATTGRLVGATGPITAAAMLGGYAVAYKDSAAYMGQYVGAPVVWQWDQVPAEFGCVGPEAVVDVGGAHFVVGPDNFWLFDGTRPTPMGAGVREFFFADSSAAERYRTVVAFDRQTNLVWVHYAGVGSMSLNKALVYHLLSRRWGSVSLTIEAALSFVSPGLTMDTLPYASYDAMPDDSFDSPVWQSSARSKAVFDAGHNLRTLTGAPGDSAFITGDYGDDWAATYVRGVALRFLTRPSSSSCVGFTRAVHGGPAVEAGNALLSDNRYDLRQDARWHRFACYFTGAVEVTALALNSRTAGRR